MPSLSQFFQGSKLRKRFIIFFIVLAVVPVLVLGSVSLVLLNRSHQEDVKNLQEQLLEQKVQEIEKFFVDTAGVLELKVGLEEAAPLSQENQEFLLEGLLLDNDAFEEIVFVTLEGQETSVQQKNEQERVLRNVAHLPYFQQAKEGSSFVGEVERRGDVTQVTVASPVKNRNGEIIQVLAANVNLKEIVHSIETATLGREGVLALKDRSGTTIVQGEAAAVQDIYSISTELPGLGWVLETSWPTRDADAIIHTVRNQVILVVLLSILAVLLIAPFLAHRLVAPIRAMQKSAAAIEKGNFEEEVEVNTGDELEELGDSFNKMRKGLKRLRELQNEFVFVAAHELRAPVTAIHWYLSGILSNAKKKKLQATLQPVKESNDRLRQLVQDLLEIARADAGRLKVEVKACNLGSIVQGVVKEMQPLAQQKGVKLEYKKESIGKVLADEARLQEVLVNLVSNAIKYNRKGGSVAISHEKTPKAVITHVTDTGLGIPQKDQKHIFEKFFRVEGKKRANIGGTGLGLFIVKQLLERMQGSIWFESKEKEGTTFSFQLSKVKGSSA